MARPLRIEYPGAFYHDALGRHVAMIDANGHRWGSEYDAMGRKTATVYPDGTRSSIEYDALGRKAAEIDQAGIKTEFLYDEDGNITGVNDAEGGYTGYTYDEEGNLLTITDPNNHVTEFTYDAIGRKKSRELPLDQIETWNYEDCCRASSHKDFNEAIITYQYDSMKREISRAYPDGKTVTTTYNPRGQRKTVTYDIGDPVTRQFEYDIMGRLTKDNKEDGQSISYKYDEAGNLIETSYSGGHVVHYTHDALNRLETVTDEKGTTKYTYDKVGNRKSMTYPNETVATCEYDNLNRLIYLENKGPSGIISSYHYTLGPAGNRLKIEENNGDICDYSYDKLYRLTRESRTGDHAYEIGYTYDAFGNRLEMNAGGAVTTYDYDDNDRLLEESGPTGVVEYDYDKNGNTISKEGPDGNWIYEWNFDNKLITAKLNDQPSASYQYDIDGERVTKTTPDGSTQFLIDINNKTGYSQALRETDQSNTELVAYTFGDDLISQKRTETSYYHYDGLGSTRALTSPANIVTDTFSYFSFGSILARTGVTQNTFLFTGDMYDFNIGFYYLRARLYNPLNGIFTSSDPFSGLESDPLSLHKYVYASQNPATLVDPSGYTIYSFMIIISIISILVSTTTIDYDIFLEQWLGPEVVFTYATKEICWEPHRPCPNCPPICYEAINEVVSMSRALPPPLVPSRIGNYEGTILRARTICNRPCDPTDRRWGVTYGTFYINTSHPDDKDIHGGGSGDPGACEFRQRGPELLPTLGCIRMWNNEGQELCNALMGFWDRYPNTDITFAAR